MCRICNGQRGNPINPNVTICNQCANIFVNNGDLDLALQRISNIPELGQVSFASKVCSFCAPDKCGIYDSRIANRFQNTQYAMKPNQGGVTNPKSIIYKNYCNFLQQIASELNFGINNFNLNWKWTDWNGTQHNWRAIDVERVLF